MKKTTMILIMLVSFVLSAQMKFAYVNSDKVLAEYNEAKKAQDQLAKFGKEMESKIISMESELQALQEELNNMPSMVSEQKKNEKLEYGQKKTEEYYRYKQQANIDFNKKQNELMTPILQKVNEIIDSISKEKDFDFVYDGNTGTLLYAKPEYDITELVLQELNKENIETPKVDESSKNVQKK